MAGLSSFRRSTTIEKQRKSSGGGKGSRGHWRDRLRIPQNAAAALIFQDHEYVDPNPSPREQEVAGVGPDGRPNPVMKTYFKYMRHRRVMGQKPNQQILDEPCSKGWDPHNPQPCAGCTAQDMGDKSVGLSEAYVQGVIHLHPYHRHPIWDNQKNQWVMKSDNSGLVLVDEECRGSLKTCNICRQLAGQQLIQFGKHPPMVYPPDQIQTVFGARRYLELGSGHLADLGSCDQTLGSVCASQKYAFDHASGQYIRDSQGNYVSAGKCGTVLEVSGYSCPACKTQLINAAADPRPLEQLEAFVMETPLPCPTCSKMVFAKDDVVCTGCGNPSFNSLFDGVIWVGRQGENTQSHVVLMPPHYQSIEEFEAQHIRTQPYVQQMLQGKSLTDRINELDRAYDFSETFKPRDLQAQAKKLRLENLPLASSQYQQGYAQPPQYTGYAQPQQPQGYGPQPGYAPAPQQGGYPGYPQPQQPGYGYGAPQQPGPAAFVPPNTPNFGK